MRLTNNLVRVLTILSIILGIFVSFFIVEDRYVTAEELKYMEQRINNKVTNRLDNIERRVLTIQLLLLQDKEFKLKQYIRNYPNDAESINELRRVQQEIFLLKKKLGII